MVSMQLINSEICKFKIVSDPPKWVRERACVGGRSVDAKMRVNRSDPVWIPRRSWNGKTDESNWPIDRDKFSSSEAFSLRLPRTYFVSLLSNFFSLLHFLRFAPPFRNGGTRIEIHLLSALKWLKIIWSENVSTIAFPSWQRCSK